MKDRPFFSIVCAAYQRGEHIGPTVESALGQSFKDFELIVVGDGCSDATARTVQSYGAAGVQWLNLPANTGSQSAPNNAGIACARGEWICYLGHDDVWSPDHLRDLWELVHTDPKLDFAVAGCVYHGPPESDHYVVTGLFDKSDAAFQHFFPPSSLTHRRGVVERIGEWRDPRQVAPPVDCEFLLRAAREGCRFASTGRISVHKFAAGQRYLSYLRPDSAEQRAILTLLSRGQDVGLDRIVESSKRERLFMAMHYPDFATFEAGELFERNRKNKGISRAALRPLAARAVLTPSNEPRGLDWHPVEAGPPPFRWSGPNPHPRILIPYTGAWARITLRLTRAVPAAALKSISVAVENRDAPFQLVPESQGAAVLAFAVRLSRTDHTVVTLHTPDMLRLGTVGGSSRRVGVPLCETVVEPLPLREVVAHLLGRGARLIEAPAGRL